ncbi:hypothetical protein FPHOBKDP_00027 [Listeria phage LPJP1]|nr:hypothetical protein FPHOBKDP_00027 [Listeria phage LPJP1]
MQKKLVEYIRKYMDQNITLENSHDIISHMSTLLYDENVKEMSVDLSRNDLMIIITNESLDKLKRLDNCSLEKHNMKLPDHIIKNDPVPEYEKITNPRTIGFKMPLSTTDIKVGNSRSSEQYITDYIEKNLNKPIEVMSKELGISEELLRHYIKDINI